MKITLKLYATLGPYLPARSQGNVVELDVPAGTTPEQAISDLGVPLEMVHLVLLNGVYLDKDERSSRAVQSGDVIAVWPPVAGG